MVNVAVDVVNGRGVVVMGTGGFDVLGLLMGWFLDETALAVARGYLERKKERRWMLLRGSLLVVESQDAARQ